MLTVRTVHIFQRLRLSRLSHYMVVGVRSHNFQTSIFSGWFSGCRPVVYLCKPKHARHLHSDTVCLFDILFTCSLLFISLWAISLFLGGVLGTVCLLSYDFRHGMNQCVQQNLWVQQFRFRTQTWNQTAVGSRSGDELDSDLGLEPICSWVQAWVQVGFGSRLGTNLQLGPGLGPGWIRIQVWDQTYVWVQTWDQVGFWSRSGIKLVFGSGPGNMLELDPGLGSIAPDLGSCTHRSDSGTKVQSGT